MEFVTRQFQSMSTVQQGSRQNTGTQENGPTPFCPVVERHSFTVLSGEGLEGDDVVE
jgi:hypothetical protein